MFRAAAPRFVLRSAATRASIRSVAPPRRCISTAPPSQKSRSWKSLVARFGIAGAIVYYYNTTDVFAEEPRHLVQALPETETESEHLPTIESISAERQKRKAVQAQLDAQKEAQSVQQNGGAEGGGMEGLEGEADQQGAFNPETGEINWDCPCLGGMATGPCGDEFKAAFSCFVFSEEEPKGMDCIDKFKNMQNCFRQYPEVYGSELEADAADDEDDLPADAAQPVPANAESSPQKSSTPTTTSTASSQQPKSSVTETHTSTKAKHFTESSSTPPAPASSSSDSSTSSGHGHGLVPDNYKPAAKKSEEPVSESEQLVPRAAHDSTDANTGVLERK